MKNSNDSINTNILTVPDDNKANGYQVLVTSIVFGFICIKISMYPDWSFVTTVILSLCLLAPWTKYIKKQFFISHIVSVTLLSILMHYYVMWFLGYLGII